MLLLPLLVCFPGCNVIKFFESEHLSNQAIFLTKNVKRKFKKGLSAAKNCLRPNKAPAIKFLKMYWSLEAC